MNGNTPRFPRSGRLDLIAQKMLAAGVAAPVGNGQIIIDTTQFACLISAILGQSQIKHKSSAVSNTGPALFLPKDDNRDYLFLQNQDPNNGIYVGIDCWATPADGMYLAPNYGYWEPYKVPTGDVWVIAAAGAPQIFAFYGIMSFGNG